MCLSVFELEYGLVACCITCWQSVLLFLVFPLASFLLPFPAECSASFALFCCCCLQCNKDQLLDQLILPFHPKRHGISGRRRAGATLGHGVQTKM
jgi:hypothetical protein